MGRLLRCAPHSLNVSCIKAMKAYMKNILLIVLLAATTLPILYFVAVFAYFDYFAQQSWFYSDAFWDSKSVFIIFLLATYIYMISKNSYLSKESKRNWYIAIGMAGPFSMLMFWFKYAWPTANKSFKPGTPKSGAP